MTASSAHDLDSAVVDTHVHVWDPGTAGLDPALAPWGSREVVVQTLDQHGIGRAVAVQPSIHGADHSYLVRSIRVSDGRLVGVGLVEPTSSTTATEQIERLCAAPEIVGLRVPLIRAPDGWFRVAATQIWAAARAHSLVLCAFVRPSDYPALLPLLEQFPTVRVVIDHVGRVDLAGSDRPAALATLKELAAFPQVGFKLSALGAVALGEFPHRESWQEVNELVDAFDASRITWGSDFPSSLAHGPYRNELEGASMALRERTSVERDAIFRSNALRLYWARA